MLINEWDIIYLLLQKGADLLALNEFNQTPTFFANKDLKHKIFIPTISHMEVLSGNS
jgi:ankyrin repeat protein